MSLLCALLLILLGAPVQDSVSASSDQADNPTAMQNSLKQGQNWEAKKEYQKALEDYEQAGVLGSGYACKKVATFYDLGEGVPIDKREALTWYKKASQLLPTDRAVKGQIAALELNLILSSTDPSPQDVTAFRDTFHRQLLFGCVSGFVIYLVAGGMLLYFSWRGGASGLVVAAGWLVLFVGAQIVAMLTLVASPLPLSSAYLMVITAAMSAGPVILATSFGPVRARMWSQSDCGWKTKVACLGLAVGVVLFLLFGYDQLYQWVTQSTLPEQPTIKFIGDLKETSLLLAYGVVALVMPMAEEILFRGFLFEAISSRVSPLVAVLHSSLAFALLHLQLDYFIPLLIFGLLLGYVRLKTKSLRLPYFLHAFNNALSLAMV